MVNFVFPSWPAIRPVNVVRNSMELGRSYSSTDGAGEVVALQGLDILDLEGVEVEVIQPEKGN